MLKHFQVITSNTQAWIGLVAATMAAGLYFWIPSTFAIPLLFFALPTGLYCLSYLVVHSFWPALAEAGNRCSVYVGKIFLMLRRTDMHAEEEPEARLTPSESARLFSDRFAEAFPGVRTVQWYEGREAVRRLAILLRKPLVFKNEDGYTTPIWWWRGGNLQIESFRQLSKTLVLLDSKELNVNRIAAVPATSYYRSFVYVEAKPKPPCGAYGWDGRKKQALVDEAGYASEEYGLYKGKYIVSRAEYDDNAAMIRGKLITMGRDVELRERYVTPYNLVIAPHSSPINNPGFDEGLCRLLNGMLANTTALEELISTVNKLPKRPVLG